MSSQSTNVIGLFVTNIGFKSEALNQAADSKIFLCTNDDLIEIIERCYEDIKKESFLNFGDVIIDDLEFNDGKIKRIDDVDIELNIASVDSY
ncbi:19649_t:CDS:2 [Dentiscutata erythropus]|uniref:19649_t:CDS:1 n=1 Tax=Dentiscutata erythropus TaxID=1348616 RepID=A0A9N9NGG7_9GLOM|nr:19649_t:CDS:2 [Dentiscutata erythropus]